MPTPNNIIDLKQVQLFIVDGYSNAGAVNNSGGYTVGATTIAMDSLTGIIPVGTTFNVGNSDPTVYEVLTHTETSSNTTSITFTPGLVQAATDNEVLTFLPHQIEVRIGEGNFQYTEKVDRQYKKNRGKLDTVRNGDEQEMDVSFDFVYDHIIGSTNDPVTVEEALKGIGNAASWVSSSADACEPYAVDLILLYTPVCTGVEVERYVFEDFRHESLDHNVKDGTISAKGSCNRTRPTITRQAAA